MRASFTQLYLHYVWATWDRLHLITPDIQKEVYAAIVQECEQLKCTVIANPIRPVSEKLRLCNREFHLPSISFPGI